MIRLFFVHNIMKAVSLMLTWIKSLAKKVQNTKGCAYFSERNPDTEIINRSFSSIGCGGRVIFEVEPVTLHYKIEGNSRSCWSIIKERESIQLIDGSCMVELLNDKQCLVSHMAHIQAFSSLRLDIVKCLNMTSLMWLL